MNMPDNLILVPMGPTAIVNWIEPTAFDYSGSQTLTSSHNPGETFFIGDTKVTYTSVDPLGNTATKSFIVTVQGRIHTNSLIGSY